MKSQPQLHDRRHKGWFWIENNVLDLHAPILGATGIAVYALLARHAGSDGRAFPSLHRFQTLLGLSRNTVKKYLKLLASPEVGLIHIVERKTLNGDADSHIYELLTVKGGSTIDLPGSTIDLPGSTIDLPGSTIDLGVGQPLTGGRSTIDPEGNYFKETQLKEEERRDIHMNLEKFSAIQNCIRSLPWSLRENATTFQDSALQALEAFCPQGMVQREHVVADRGDGTRGKIDIFIASTPCVAIELDDVSPRQKSIAKLLAIDGYRLVGLRSFYGDPAQVWPGVVVIGSASPYDGHGTHRERPTTNAPTGENGAVPAKGTRQRNVSTPEALAVRDHLNAVNSRNFQTTDQIEKLLATGVSVADCKLVIDFGFAVMRQERGEWYEQYFNNVTPFRPENFDKYRARAEVWRQREQTPPRRQFVV